MILLLYNAVLTFVLIAGLPLWSVLALVRHKYREGLRERLGRLPSALFLSGHDRPRIWVHAVSVGEVLAVTRLVSELDGQARGHTVVISTTTRTGQQLARERFGRERTFYFPFDFPWVVKRVLRRLRPAMLVLAESELWPNLMAQCREMGVPVAVVNARISDRSLPRYLRLRWFWRHFLPALTVVLAQSEEDRARFLAIGVPEGRVNVAGNLKFEVRAPRETELVSMLRSSVPAGAQVLVCGSTLEGEEAMLLRAWTSLRSSGADHSVMILAPRHPERFARVADLLERSGLPSVRRSSWLQAPTPFEPGSVFLLDTVGELAGVYALASVAFVGGSLVPAGGHNPLEPAQFGVPVVMGPHRENFRSITDQLLREGALLVVTPETLEPQLSDLLRDSAKAQQIGLRGRRVFESEAGATSRVVAALLPLLAGTKAAR